MIGISKLGFSGFTIRKGFPNKQNMRMASSLNSSPPRPNYDADFDDADSLDGFEEDMGYFDQASDEGMPLSVIHRPRRHRFNHN